LCRRAVLVAAVGHPQGKGREGKGREGKGRDGFGHVVKLFNKPANKRLCGDFPGTTAWRDSGRTVAGLLRTPHPRTSHWEDVPGHPLHPIRPQHHPLRPNRPQPQPISFEVASLHPWRHHVTASRRRRPDKEGGLRRGKRGHTGWTRVRGPLNRSHTV
jgi:hypothetical protein